jgi:hypothetical protein
MLKTDTHIIEGATYTITQLPAMRGLRLFARVARVLGPALGKLGAAKAGGIKIGGVGVSEEAFGTAIETLFDKLSPDEFELVLSEFFWSLTRNGKKVAPGAEFDLEMAGQLVTILKLLKFAFEVNYGNFTAAVVALMPAAEVPAKP